MRWLGSFGTKATAVGAGIRALMAAARSNVSLKFVVRGPGGEWWYRRTFPGPTNLDAGVEEYEPPRVARL